MYATLAQLSNPPSGNSSAFDVITGIFSHGDALAQPAMLVDGLQRMSIVWALIFLVVGLLCLFSGYRYYRVTTILLSLFLGAFLGYALGKHIGAEWVVAGCLGALLGIICFPLMKYAVAVLGGLTGAYLGANLWSALSHLMASPQRAADLASNYWVGALIGLIVCGMLAFILFKLTIILTTSVSGSTIAVLGCIALLLQLPTLQQHVANGLTAHAIVIPILVLVPAMIGLVMQETSPEAGKKKEAKPA